MTNDGLGADGYVPCDWQRAKTLDDALPLIRACKSILHVGEQLRDGWLFWPDWFARQGVETFDVLEIWPPNVKKLGATGRFRNLYTGDVRDCAQMSVANCDLVFWWHGPEHILKCDFQTSVDNLVGGWKPRLVILGMPWGLHGNCGHVFENKASYHVSTWYPEELQALGWITRTDGPKDVPVGHISAWKAFGQ